MKDFYNLQHETTIQLIFETLSIFEEYCKSFSDKIEYSYFLKKYESLKTTSLAVSEVNLQTPVLNCNFKCSPDIFSNFLCHMNTYKSGKMFECKNKHVIQVEMFIVLYTIHILECNHLDYIVKMFVPIFQDFPTTLSKCKQAFISRRSKRNVKKKKK